MSRILSCVLLFAAIAAADTFTFDFEGLPPAAGETSITAMDGLGSLTITAIGGSPILGLSDLSLFGGDPAFGLSTVGAFGPPDTLGITFAGLPAGHDVLGITFTFGDFGPSDTDEITMTVLRSDGPFAGMSTVDGLLPGFNTTTTGIFEPAGLFAFVTGDQMLITQAGGNSLYFDNFIIETGFASGESPMGDFSGGGMGGVDGTSGQFPPDGVPEPISTVLVGVGIALLGLRRRLR